MNTLRKISHAWFVALAAVLLLAGAPAQAAGTFRFLTTELPEGSTNGQYFTKLLTANGAGQVEFSVKTGCGAQVRPAAGRPVARSTDRCYHRQAYNGEWWWG